MNKIRDLTTHAIWLLHENLVWDSQLNYVVCCVGLDWRSLTKLDVHFEAINGRNFRSLSELNVEDELVIERKL